MKPIFQSFIKRQQSKGCKLRYVASFEGQKLTTGLSQVGMGPSLLSFGRERQYRTFLYPSLSGTAFGS